MTLPPATPNARPVPANPHSRFIPRMRVITPALMMGTQAWTRMPARKVSRAAHGVTAGHDLAQYGGKGGQPGGVAQLGTPALVLVFRSFRSHQLSHVRSPASIPPTARWNVPPGCRWVSSRPNDLASQSSSTSGRPVPLRPRHAGASLSQPAGWGPKLGPVVPLRLDRFGGRVQGFAQGHDASPFVEEECGDSLVPDD